MSAAIVYDNVQLGEDVELGPFVVVGEPPRGASPGQLATVIGPGARIRSHTVIYAGNRVGARFMTGHGALVRENNRIGDQVSIGSHAIVEHDVEITDHVRVHSGAFVPEFSILHEGAWVGPNAVLTNARYPTSPSAKDDLRGPVLGRRCRIGANATLLPGVVIGDDALVGAGAVVVRDVPPDTVVVGSPARQIGRVSELPAYRRRAIEEGARHG